MSMTPSFPNAFGPGIWIKLDLVSIHVQNEKKEKKIEYNTIWMKVENIQQLQ